MTMVRELLKKFSNPANLMFGESNHESFSEKCHFHEIWLLSIICQIKKLFELQAEVKHYWTVFMKSFLIVL